MRNCLTSILASATLTSCSTLHQSEPQIRESNVHFYGTDVKPRQITPETISNISTVEEAQRSARIYIIEHQQEFNFFNRRSTDDVLYNNAPGSCTEAAFLIYDALDDDGLQPHFLLLKQRFVTHLVNLIKVDSMYGISGLNGPDFVSPTHTTIEEAITTLNYQYAAKGESIFRGYKIVTYDPDHIKHNTQQFTIADYFGFKPLSIEPKLEKEVRDKSFNRIKNTLFPPTY